MVLLSLFFTRTKPAARLFAQLLLSAEVGAGRNRIFMLANLYCLFLERYYTTNFISTTEIFHRLTPLTETHRCLILINFRLFAATRQRSRKLPKAEAAWSMRSLRPGSRALATPPLQPGYLCITATYCRRSKLQFSL